MNTRIALVIKAKNITPSQLADELGIQRSGLSHILNNRNKPSLEFIQKLLKKYPDLSTNWLLFGEGPMMNPYPAVEKQVVIEPSVYETKIHKPLQQPGIMELFPPDDQEANEYLKEKEESTGKNPAHLLDNEENIDENKQLFQEHIFASEKLTNTEAPKKAENVNNLPSAETYVQEPLSENTTTSPENKKSPALLQKNSRTVKKIVIFYSDHTFVEYKPGGEED